jgi:GxxExxY protein
MMEGIPRAEWPADNHFASLRLCVRPTNPRGDHVTENEIARQAVDVAYQIHTTLGPGLLESVYQKVMAYELRNRGADVQTEVGIPIRWNSYLFDEGFRADMLVDRKVVIELKSVEKTHPVHKKILLTYLRLTDCRLGLLINFGEEKIKDGITRVVNGLADD